MDVLFIHIGAIGIPPLLCAIIAGTENRNKFRWFFYGLFFGIFAVIYIVFYSKEGDDDKIKPRVLILLAVMWGVSLIGIYENFFGLIVNIK
jgi:hypothetical protein